MINSIILKPTKTMMKTFRASFMKRKIYAFLCSMLLAFTAIAQSSVEGCVMLNDSVPAAFATIYVPATGQGCTTDLDGRYVLEDLATGNVVVEYSYLGYATEHQTLMLPEAKRYAHDVRLKEQPITLGDIYVTPSGEDPAVYILRKVGEQAALNKKRLKQFDAVVTHSLEARDMDIFRALFPKPILWMMRMALKTAGFGAIFDYCTENNYVKSKLRINHHFAKGKTKYSGQQVLESTPAMPDNVAKQICKMSQGDLFDEIYGEFELKKQKKSKKTWKLQGTIEENGKTIDVLTYESQIVHLNDSNSVSISVGSGSANKRILYVVDGEWGILRKESESGSSYARTECRDLGGGIYMPISYLEEQRQDAEQLNRVLREMIAESEKPEQQKEVSKMERNMLNRLKALLDSGRKINPCMPASYSVHYSNVIVEK